MSIRPEQADRRRPGRGRLLVNLTVLFLGLAILVMWLPFLVPHSFVERRLRAVLAERVCVPFTLESAALRGWTGVEVRGMAIGEGPAVRLERVRLVFSPLRLLGLGGARGLGRIEIAGARVRPGPASGGTPDLFSCFRLPGRGEASLAEQVVVRGATIELDALLPGRGASAVVDLRAERNGDATSVRAAGRLQLDGETLPFRARGVLSIRTAPDGRGRARLVTLAGGGLSLGSDADAYRFAVADVDLVAVADRFGVRIEGVQGRAPDGLRFNFSSAGPPESRTAVLRAGAPSFDASALCSLIRRVLSPPAVAAAVPRGAPAGETTAAAALEAVMPSPDREAAPAPGPLAWLRGLRGRCETDFDSLTLFGHRLRDVRHGVELSDGVLTTSGPPFGYNGGRVEAVASLDLRGAAPRWSLKGRGTEIEPAPNIAAWLRHILVIVRPEEPFDVAADLTGAGFSGEALRSAVYGDLAFDFRGGRVEMGRPPAGIALAFPSLDADELPFSSGQGVARCAGHRVTFDLRFQTGLANAVGIFIAGEADLAARTLAVDFGVDPLMSLGATLRPGSRLRGATDIVVLRLTGRFDAPIEHQWYEVPAEKVASLFKQILWDDPTALASPGMSARERGAYFGRRLRAALGVGIRPLLWAGEGARSLLAGAHDPVRGMLQALIGEESGQ